MRPDVYLQDFYLEDILKLIGYKAPDDYSLARAAAAGSQGNSEEGPLARLQRAATEQAVMDAFLKGDEGSWGRLLEVTGAQEGSGNPACINASHPATGHSTSSICHACLVCLSVCLSVFLSVVSLTVFLSDRLTACLWVCLYVCVSVWLFVCRAVSHCAC